MIVKDINDVLNSINEYYEQMKEQRREDHFLDNLKSFINIQKSSISQINSLEPHSSPIELDTLTLKANKNLENLKEEEKDIHKAIQLSVGMSAYLSYFLNSLLRIEENMIYFDFPGKFAMNHAEKQYKSKVQEAIRSLKDHENTVVIFFSDKKEKEDIAWKSRHSEPSDKKSLKYNRAA